MTFTRRTYRVAIRRSMNREQQLRANWERSKPGWHSTDAHFRWLDQTAHTARLQRRKRRERK